MANLFRLGDDITRVSSPINGPIAAAPTPNDEQRPAPRHSTHVDAPDVALKCSTDPDASSQAHCAPRPQRYLLISPCRDEAEYLRRTLDSVAVQSVTPALWIVVDDGSSDGTSEILAQYTGRLSYLRVVTRRDRGSRQVGPGVIEAFYAGLDTVLLEDFDYVCKLDMDLDLPARYFELLMQRMEDNPRLGTTSGKPWYVHPQSGRMVPEICGDEMSVGMTKFYRVSCFQEIGGFVRQVMWDGIDCHRARMLGWIAESVHDEPLRFLHLRQQGGSQKNLFAGRVRAGFGQYFMGTAPVYHLVRSLRRLPEHPALIGSALMIWGYFKSWVERRPRYDDPAFRRFLRSYQYACLVMGKHAATAREEARREALWQAHHPQSHSARKPAQTEKKVDLLGLAFDSVTIEEATARCVEMCRGPRTSRTVMTANASHLCMMRHDAALARACQAADLVVADGMSVVWALRAAGQPVPERVAGIDLMEKLLPAAEANGLSVYFLGARKEVVSELVRRCRALYPGLKIAGFRDGYFTLKDHPAVVEEIRASGAQMLFIGMPSPFKETWTERHRDKLCVPVIMGVGGSFDVLAGFIQRAPKWVQSIGFEWFWRLLMEPRKLWKRYLSTNSEFVWLAGREIILRRSRRTASSHPNLSQNGRHS